MENKKWENGIDILKIISMCFIIITHCSWSEEQRQLLLFPFWIDMAVPILMIITGYNYYHSFERYGNYSKKIIENLQRILIPFFITMSLQYFALIICEKRLISPVYIIKGGYGPGGYYTIVMIQVILLFPFIYNTIKKFKYGFFLIILINIFFELTWSIFLFQNVSMLTLYTKNMIYRLLALRYWGFIAAGAWYAKLGNKKYTIYKLRYFIGIFGVCIIYLWQYKGIKMFIFDNEWAPTTLPCVFISFAYFLIIKDINVKTHRFITEMSKSTFHVYLFQMCYFGFIVPNISMIYDNFFLFSIILSILICFCGGYLFYKSEYVLRQVINKIVNN